MKRLLLVLTIICFKNGLYAMSSQDLKTANKQFLQNVIDEQYGKVIASLKSKSVDINTANEHGQTALILAVRGQDEEMVRILLDYLPDINKKDFSNKTAFDYAKELKKDESDVIDLLKRYKKSSAPAALLSIESLTPLQAIKLRNSELRKAINDRNIPRLSLLLDYYAKEHNLYLEEESKTNIELDPGKKLSLYLGLDTAIYKGDKTKIQMLLKNNAGINPITHKEGDILLKAFNSEKRDIFQLVLESLADPNIDLIRDTLNEKESEEDIETPEEYKYRQDIKEILDIYDAKQEAKKLLERVKPIKIAEIKKALELANWPTDVANIVCEY